MALSGVIQELTGDKPEFPILFDTAAKYIAVSFRGCVKAAPQTLHVEAFNYNGTSMGKPVAVTVGGTAKPVEVPLKAGANSISVVKDDADAATQSVSFCFWSK